MAYADGKGEHSAGVQRTHFIQNIKAFFHHPADIPLFHHRNIAAVGHLAQETGRAADVFFQQGVDGLQLVRLLGVLHIVEQLVIAVHPNNQVSRAAGSVFIQRVFVECIVDQKQQCARFAAAAGCGIGRVAVFVNGQVLAVGAGTDGKVNAGHQAVRCSQQGILPRQDLLPEGRIIPHHGAFGNQGSGDGKIRQRILGLAALKVGPAQHIGHKAPQPADAKHRHHQRKHYKQRRCQQPARVAERQRHSQSDARNEQQKDNDKDITSQLVFHHRSSVPAMWGRRSRSDMVWIKLPSEWAESWGCAWFCGRYSWKAPPARGISRWPSRACYPPYCGQGPFQPARGHRPSAPRFPAHRQSRGKPGPGRKAAGRCCHPRLR